jgi:hypothetical protein
MCIVTYAHTSKINLLQIIVNISFSGRLSGYSFDYYYVDLIMRRYIVIAISAGAWYYFGRIHSTTIEKIFSNPTA